MPETDFDGLSIWKDGETPDEADIAERLRDSTRPIMRRLPPKDRAGDGDRRRDPLRLPLDPPHIPLPTLPKASCRTSNIGTDMGKTCDSRIEQAVVAATASTTGYDSILNGRFKGGWTTQHYGPAGNRHAYDQMELAQSASSNRKETALRL